MRSKTGRKSLRELRQMRQFSEEFKRSKVKEIESGLTRVREICREYEVSDVAGYKWLHNYSKNMKGKPRTIVESQSDTLRMQMLKEKIAELERLLGQKQIEVEFLSKVIDIAEEKYRVDIKKSLVGSRNVV